MDIHKMTKAELIAKIENMELMLSQMKEENEKSLSLEFSWTGNLGHWFWNYRTNEVMFNPMKVLALGYDRTEIPESVTYQFFTEKIHPDDYKKTMDSMISLLKNKASIYECEYRIRTKSGEYKWFYDRGTITKRDETGKPILIAGIVFDITAKKELELELIQKNNELRRVSSIDALTNLINHRVLYEKLDEMIKDKSKHPLSVAMFDLDDFKKINDQYGHIFGDQILREVSDVLREYTASDVLAGRYGGEEFLVIFPNHSTDDAYEIADRIRSIIEKKYLNQPFKLTISGGVSTYISETAAELIHRADILLYEAKRYGKNKIKK